MVEVICHAAIAVLAVFGGYSLVRLLWESFFGHEAIITAVELRNRADLEELPALLLEASRRFSPGKNRRIYLLVPEELYADPELRTRIFRDSEDARIVICPTVGYL